MFRRFFASADTTGTWTWRMPLTTDRRRDYLAEVEDPFSLIGATIDGKYRVDAPIGEGGFGIVYKGWHQKFRRSIAIKCLKIPAHFAAPAKRVFLDRFNEEGRTLFRLSEHPHIVRVFDCGITTTVQGHEVPYLILEWLEGQSLDTVIAEKMLREGRPYTELEVAELMLPAIEGLAFAHKRGIVHRDIKPENLFVVRGARKQPSVKVLDFGIAKVVEDGETESRKLAHSTFVAFSPSWAAPEQFYAKRYGTTGRWTDVHAFGLIFVFAVTGRSPLEGDELIELMRSALAERRPTPRSRGAWVSDAFEQLVAKAIALRREDRFQNAGELLIELKRFIDANVPREGVVHPPVKVAIFATFPQAAESDESGQSISVSTNPVASENSIMEASTPVVAARPTAVVSVGHLSAPPRPTSERSPAEQPAAQKRAHAKWNLPKRRERTLPPQDGRGFSGEAERSARSVDIPRKHVPFWVAIVIVIAAALVLAGTAFVLLA